MAQVMETGGSSGVSWLGEGSRKNLGGGGEGWSLKLVTMLNVRRIGVMIDGRGTVTGFLALARRKRELEI